MQIYVKNLIVFFCGTILSAGTVSPVEIMLTGHKDITAEYYHFVQLCEYSDILLLNIDTDSSIRVTNTINVTLSVADTSGHWRTERRPL